MTTGKRKPRSTREAAAPSAAEDLARRIGGRIREGKIPAGAWLRETRLAEEFGAGRMTVREALRLLADDGLVRIERNRGACVAEIGLHDMFDLFEMRAALYGVAARFTCFRASDEEIETIVAMIDELISSGERRAPAEQRVKLGGEIFARLTANASEDAQRTIELINRKSRWHYSYVGLAESPGGRGPMDQWRAMSQALVARDADAAADAARRAIYFMQTEVMRVMVARGASRKVS